MHAEHVSLSVLAAAIVLTLPVVLSGCGNPHASSDAARIGVVQEIRQDLKKDPRDRDQRFLNLTRGAQIILDPDRPIDEGGMGGGTEGERLSDDERMAIMDARLRAQEGALQLYGGDVDGGLATLEASMSMRPTLDAALPLADHYRTHGDETLLTDVCVRTRPEVGDNELYELLDACRLGDPEEPLDTQLRWTAPADRTWFETEQETRQQ